MRFEVDEVLRHRAAPSSLAGLRSSTPTLRTAVGRYDTHAGAGSAVTGSVRLACFIVPIFRRPGAGRTPSGVGPRGSKGVVLADSLRPADLFHALVCDY